MKKTTPFPALFIILLLIGSSTQEETDETWASNVSIAGTGCPWSGYDALTDSEDSTNAVSLCNGGTETIVLSNFEFDPMPPTDANIDGIVITVNRGCSGTNLCCDNLIRLTVSGNAVGDNKAHGCGNEALNRWPGSLQTISYGSSADTWSLSPSTSVSSLGVLIAGSRSDQGGPPSATLSIQSVTMTVHYTLANPTTGELTTDSTTGISTTGVSPTTGVPPTSGPLGTTGSNVQEDSGLTRGEIGLIAAIVGVGIIVILVFVAGIFLFIRIRKGPPSSENVELMVDEPSGAYGKPLPVVLPPVDETSLSIPISAFQERIEELKKPFHENHPDISGFLREFTYIEEKSEGELDISHFSIATAEENKTKNRYQNVLAPDASRVILKGVEEDQTDYINANWIDGDIPKQSKVYIATQGPVQNFYGDFWGMVWNENASVILMLTKEVESFRLKCDRYWPEEEKPMEFDNFRVTLKSTKETGELTSRTFTLENLSTEESRTIQHYQYTLWPDHGVPESTRAFLELSQAADEANTSKGPIIAHCSAGVGRTGTFCTIHSVLKRIKLELEKGQKDPEINVAEVVLKMRTQRPNMVQTVEQYEFCYHAIGDGLKELLKKKK